MHRSTWFSVWGTVVLLGVGLGFLVWTAAEIVVIFTLAAGVATLVTSAYYRRERHPAPPPGGLARTAIEYAGMAGASLVAITAAAAVAPYVMWPLLLLAVTTSPWLTGMWSKRVGEGARATFGPELVDTTSPASVALALTDLELCDAWRASFEALQRAGSAGEWAAAVALRRAYLDEIERRNPSALNAWLDSGARAAGGPDRYLLREKRFPEAS